MHTLGGHKLVEENTQTHDGHKKDFGVPEKSPSWLSNGDQNERMWGGGASIMLT